jgi:hypothetical protein
VSGEYVPHYQKSRFADIQVGDIVYVEGQDWMAEASLKAVGKVVDVYNDSKEEKGEGPLDTVIIEDENQSKLHIWVDDTGDLVNIDLWYLVERKA